MVHCRDSCPACAYLLHVLGLWKGGDPKHECDHRPREPCGPAGVLCHAAGELLLSLPAHAPVHSSRTSHDDVK